MLRRSSAVAVVATVVGGWLGQAPALADQPAPQPTGTATAAERSPAPPAVWPKPQSLRAQGRFARVTAHVTLVADPDADPYALGVVEDALRAAGATDVVRAPLPGAGLTVYAGDAALAPLSALGAPPQGDLPSGGYRLAVSGGTVALAGVGDDGLFHAAQTLRQLAATDQGERGFAAVTVRDWPTAPVRGVAESFYGVPWTRQQRLDQLDFMARTKQNRFLYAPGDDPYRQAQWREPYPAAQRADFRALARRARQDHVTLAWAVAPGQALCYASGDDRRALEKKLDAMWALGVRAFQIQFQDVSYSEWHCGADRARYGTGPDAAARAQADVANTLAGYLRGRYGPDAELSLLPTEFYEDGATPYRTALADALDAGVEVAWTGVGVLPKQITGAQVAGARDALGHPLMTLDNYPVNDFDPGRLFLGPYTGREPAVATVSAGVLASAMQQPAASRIPLFTAADYSWNPRGYDPAASWRAAVDDLAGPDPGTRAALAALAGNESSSALGGQESAYLQPLLRAFWAALEPDAAGAPKDPVRLTAAAERLRSAFTTMRTAPAVLGPLAGGTFGDEVRPWLDRLSSYGAAGEDAVDMLVAQAESDGQTAWRARRALEHDRAPLDQGTAKVGADALDGFLSRAVDDGDAWLGLRADGRTATTTMGSGRGSDPSAMVDGKDATAWSSAAPPQPDDSFGVDLGTDRPVSAVRIAMGDGSGSDDFLHDAVLEVSGDDGAGWRRIGEYHDQAVITAALPPGTRARQVRLRAAGSQPGAVTVREFAVSVSGASVPSAAGTAPGAASVVDGDLGTRAGTGEVTVRFGGARPLDTVTVAADPRTAPAAGVPAGAAADSGASAGEQAARFPLDLPYVTPFRTAAAADDPPPTVEVHTASGWHRLGTLDRSGWTELPAGLLADAVRISDADGVREVVPWFAEPPRVTADRTEIDAEAGGAPVSVTASVSAGLPRDLTAAVAQAGAPPGAPGRQGKQGKQAGAPRTGGPNAPGKHGAPAERGITVTAPRQVALPRGATVKVPLKVTVPAGTAPGTYTVPVRFTVAGRTVERRLTVRTHPRTRGPDLVPGSAATSSGDETPDFPAASVADGDPATRWSSPVADDSWVQVELPAPAEVGRVVLHWQDAYAARYEIRTSADGVTWHTAATVTDGGGGTETVWLDAPADTRFLRVQGVRRATKYGYSLFGVEAYQAYRAGATAG
ncbi:beta-N-acetylglucosaminidase domain-containing protein [Actinacidiphila sp. ITFR-21]|uniref:beta-N-acetylglucosaminidase domain-containing protein n=1 Tax=Actinacidiphila sp. ITFR-21 TaxID=3075199 RepID=UPI00288924B7|nr:beta-N-acetylglucosaminidase domain-containing protein [Streptomyces sp. ITFR-21]WNI15515.1 beta-N-acetylglucosaminidase domain-containing protein [Streptomyces sp. ITFR-21]